MIQFAVTAAVFAVLTVLIYVVGVFTGWKLAMQRVNLQLDEMQQDKSNPNN
jgi:hypothetical protein